MSQCVRREALGEKCDFIHAPKSCLLNTLYGTLNKKINVREYGTDDFQLKLILHRTPGELVRMPSFNRCAAKRNFVLARRFAQLDLIR